MQNSTIHIKVTPEIAQGVLYIQYHKIYQKGLLLSLDDKDKFTYSFTFEKQDSFQ